MAKDAAMVISWAGSIPGREAKALEVFMESLGFWAQQAEQGRCQPPEPFIAEDASGGMVILRGKSDALRELSETDESRTLLGKAQLIVQNLHVSWFYTGDAVMQETELFAKAGAALGYM
jgi:hypothetical protein